MGDHLNNFNQTRKLLRPEVEEPYKPSNGLGLLFVAGASMFFAVASSAFIVRASLMRNMTSHCTQARSVAPSTPVTLINTFGNQDCGKAVFKKRADGTTSVLYKLCR